MRRADIDVHEAGEGTGARIRAEEELEEALRSDASATEELANLTSSPEQREAAQAATKLADEEAGGDGKSVTSPSGCTPLTRRSTPLRPPTRTRCSPFCR